MTSKALVIAKKDFIDAVRSKLLWGTTLILLLLTLSIYLARFSSGVAESPRDSIQYIPLIFSSFLAPIVIIATYKSVVGERESGSLRVMFGLPATRHDFVLGKALGRSALVTTISLSVMVVIGAVTVILYGTLPILLFAIITGLILLYGLAWTGLTVGVSAVVSSRFKAISVGLGFFILFFRPFNIWNFGSRLLFGTAFTGRMLSNTEINPLEPSKWPTWYQYTQRLNPIENLEITRRYAISLADPSIPVANHTVNLFGILVLLLWFAVPLLVGYWRFKRADLT